MGSFRLVRKSDGTLGTELTVANVRRDLATGEETRLVGGPTHGGVQIVQRPDGTLGHERSIGGLRHFTGTGGGGSLGNAVNAGFGGFGGTSGPGHSAGLGVTDPGKPFWDNRS